MTVYRRGEVDPLERGSIPDVMRGCGVRYGEGGCAYIISRDSITRTPGDPFCFVAVRHSMRICISLHICAVGVVFSEEMRRRYRDPQLKEYANNTNAEGKQDVSRIVKRETRNVESQGACPAR